MADDNDFQDVLDRLRAHWRKYLNETEEGRLLAAKLATKTPKSAYAAADTKESE